MRHGLLSTACLFLAAHSAVRAQSTGLFPGELQALRSSERVALLVDLDHDAAADLITVSPLSILVRRNTADGLFGRPVEYPLGVAPLAVRSADLNADSSPDVVVATASSLIALLGDGAGGLGLPSVSAHVAGSLIEVADIDGDAHPDVLRFEPSKVTVFWGDGAGGFGLGPSQQLGNYLGAKVGDVDGDGQVDLITTSSTPIGILRSWLGDGSGTFSATPPSVTAVLPLTLAVGDLDGDGQTDAVVLASGQFQSLLSTGNGSFQSAGTTQYPTSPTQLLKSVALADLDANGAADVTLLLTNTLEARIFPGTGAGAFGPPVVTPIAAAPWNHAAGDVNGDGHMDLAVNVVVALPPGPGASHVQLVLAGSAGPFGGAPTQPVPQIPIQLLAANLDPGGHPDALVNCPAAGPLGHPALLPPTAIFLGDGSGGLAPASLHPPSGRSALGDLDGDGSLDLVTCRPLFHDLVVRLGDGSGGFGALTSFAATAPFEVALADVDRDGDLDALRTRNAQPNLYVHAGDGAGALAAEVVVALPDISGRLRSADMNGDGHADIVTSSSLSLAITLGDGAGGFSTSFVAPGSTATFWHGPADVADVNGDGALDVASIRTPPNATSSAGSNVYLGNGAGGASGPTFVPGGAAFGISLADVTGDGRADLTLAAVALSVHANDGSGKFGAATLYQPPIAVDFLAPADFDGDGQLDFAVADGTYVPLSSGEVMIVLHEAPAPMGASISGNGTPGCAGIHGIGATSVPAVGNSDFAVITTGAPPNARGLLLVGDAGDPIGTDSLGMGVLLHLDLAGSNVLGIEAASDPTGCALAPLPIPAHLEL